MAGKISKETAKQETLQQPSEAIDGLSKRFKKTKLSSELPSKYRQDIANGDVNADENLANSIIEEIGPGQVQSRMTWIMLTLLPRQHSSTANARYS